MTRVMDAVINPQRVCAARVTALGLFVCVYVCVSVTLLTAMPLMYEYKIRYKLKANVVFKVLTHGTYRPSTI